ncbi:MAG: hypothetical protein C4319_06885 [Acidimicrobiia bacterium]
MEFASRPSVKSFALLRAGIASLVGLFVYAFAAAASALRQLPPVSENLPELAVLEAHAKNVVNAVLVDLRAFDTMGEITVLVVAAIAIAVLAAEARQTISPGLPTASSPILETGSRAVFHTILILALFMFFSGHNAPGGGFVAGLVASGAFVVRYLAYGGR